MNFSLHHSLTRTVTASASLALNPYTLEYRPLGGLWYTAFFASFGFHPLPLRILCFLLLCGNLLLAYWLALVVSRSREIAVFTLLFFAYNAQMADIYFDSATIYDLLCFPFFVGALLVYHGARLSARRLPGLAYLVCAGLLIFALQAKEIACMLPVVLALEETTLAKRDREWAKPKVIIPLLLLLALAVSILWHRIAAPNVLGGNPLYHPVFSLGNYLRTMASYQSKILYIDSPESITVLLVLWMTALGLAALFRSRTMLFGFLFWIVTAIPLGVIPARAAYVLYIPYLGLALYAGALIAHVRRSLAARYLRYAGAIDKRTIRISQLATGAVVLLVLIPAHVRERKKVVPSLQRANLLIRSTASQLKRLLPDPARSARVLFTDDPFTPLDGTLSFLLPAMYGDEKIKVDRAKTKPHVVSYDYVFTFSSPSVITRLPPRPAKCGELANTFEVDDSDPAICWTGDWTSGMFREARGNTLTFSKDRNAAVTLFFSGTEVTYVYTKAFNRGKASIQIDSFDKGLVDLYSPSVAWQSSNRFSSLPDGPHRIVVSVSGEKDPRSTDDLVDIDAFFVGSDSKAGSPTPHSR